VNIRSSDGDSKSYNYCVYVPLNLVYAPLFSFPSNVPPKTVVHRLLSGFIPGARAKGAPGVSYSA